MKLGRMVRMEPGFDRIRKRGWVAAFRCGDGSWREDLTFLPPSRNFLTGLAAISTLKTRMEEVAVWIRQDAEYSSKCHFPGGSGPIYGVKFRGRCFTLAEAVEAGIARVKRVTEERRKCRDSR